MKAHYPFKSASYPCKRLKGLSLGQFRLFYLQRYFFNHLAHAFLQRNDIKIPPKTFIVLEVRIGQYGMGGHPFTTGKADDIPIVNPAGHHFEPRI